MTFRFQHRLLSDDDGHVETRENEVNHNMMKNSTSSDGQHATLALYKGWLVIMRSLENLLLPFKMPANRMVTTYQSLLKEMDKRRMLSCTMSLERSESCVTSTKKCGPIMPQKHGKDKVFVFIFSLTFHDRTC